MSSTECALCRHDVELKITSCVENLELDQAELLFARVKHRCHWCPLDAFHTICMYSTDQRAKRELEECVEQIRSGHMHVDRKHDCWPHLYLALEDRVHAKFTCREVARRMWQFCFGS